MRSKSTAQGHPRQSKEARKKSQAVSGSSAHPCKGPKGPFSCNTCGEIFSQQQGVYHHYREKHKPNLCISCNVEWSHPYQYRKHIKKCHPDLDPDMVLGKTAGSCHRAASMARDSPEQPMLSPLAVAKLLTATPLTMSSMISVLQPESTPPTMMGPVWKVP